MTKNKIPVLLTSSVVAHDTGVTLKDTDERIRLALESVEQWLKVEPTPCLVLCDGSSFNFSHIVAEKFPSAQIECLYFENNQALVEKHGRGYGEGEIVRYAVKHSKLIAKTECFAKCTSKLWVENYSQCLKNWNGSLLCKGVFLNVFSFFKKIIFSYIDTRFYIISCACYNNYFENAHLQVDSKLGHSLEDCFFDIFIKYKIDKSLFAIAPVICGVGGGIGFYYKNSVKRKIKEKLRLKLVRMNREFSHLFAEP